MWSQVAPLVPSPSFDPADPSSPGYDWSATDAAVRDLSSHGLQVLLNLTGAPTWAEGPAAPAGTQPGTWRPDPTQFASFATAAALRYDGRFPDPLQPGAFLPRVRYWQPWNEPNLAYYLSPQWTRVRGGWAPASPVIYRQLLNAFYRAVKRVSSSNFVVTAGTAPYGDPPGGQRMPPVAFDRALFCLRDDARPDPGQLSRPAAPRCAVAPPLRDQRPALARLEPGRRGGPRHVQDRARVARCRAGWARAARRAEAAVGHRNLLGQLAT